MTYTYSSGDCILTGRPSGRVGILYHKKLSAKKLFLTIEEYAELLFILHLTCLVCYCQCIYHVIVIVTIMSTTNIFIV